MKYSLYKELLDPKNILSHVFFICVNDFIKDIADKNNPLSEDEVQKRKIDIELKIDGRKCNPKLFFDELYNQYEDSVKQKAQEIVQAQTSEKLREIQDKINGFTEIFDQWSREINWQTDNLFQKNES